jgi:hypothetical protein
MTLVTQGGIGKNVALTAFIPKLAEKYGDFNVMSPWPDLFHGQKGIRRSLDMNIEYGYEDYFKGQDRLNPEPYSNNRFFKKEISLLEAFAEELGLDYDPKKDTPLSPTSLPDNVKVEIEKIRSAKKFIVTQFSGGNQAINPQPNQKIMVKDYPMDLILKFVDLFQEKYGEEYQIVNYGLEYEKIDHPAVLNVPGLPYSAIPYLLFRSSGFVAIDSNLQHFSACQGLENLKGVVIWGATSPKNFGYEKNINLTGECPLGDIHCNRPYFQHTSDIIGKGASWSCPHRTCTHVTPEVIISNLSFLKG